MKDLVTPKQVAQAIDVSESSLKRWADEGLLLVSKTAGGHRRISITAAIRFIRERQLELVRPDILGLPAKVMPGTTSATQTSQRLRSSVRDQCAQTVDSGVGLGILGLAVRNLLYT